MKIQPYPKSLFLLFCIFAFIVCARSAVALEGGSTANADQRNGIVGISYVGNFIESCIGVVLEPSRVLTTVNCVDLLLDGEVSASDIRVHPLSGTELGGTSFLPTLNDEVPFVSVASYQKHPLSTGRFGPYNLAVLNLSTPLSIGTAKIYGGDESFVGQRGIAFGWKEITRQGPIFLERSYQANTLLLPNIVDGDSNIDSLTEGGCYDNFVDTNTVFCAGYRDEFLFLQGFDNGGPMYFNFDEQNVVIGLLSFHSGGTEFEGVFDYEEYTRVSTMRAFIEQQAPNTEFVTAAIGEPESKPVISPILFLLSDD